MNMSREKILETLLANSETIRRYGVRRLGLFGSWARDEGNEGSDIDFIVEFDKKTFDNYMDLKAFLESLFKCRVDLIVREAIKPGLLKCILEETVHAPGL
jgi:predicted nucleotidyltransferase